MRTNKRIIAIVLSILFVLSVIFALLFVTTEARHVCSCEECPICAEIEACEDLLKTGFSAICALFVARLLGKIIYTTLMPSNEVEGYTSLVSLKVKLSS